MVSCNLKDNLTDSQACISNKYVFDDVYILESFLGRRGAVVVGGSGVRFL